MYAEGTGGAVVVRDAQVRDPVVCGRLHGLVPRMAYFIAYLRYGVRHMTDGLFRVSSQDRLYLHDKGITAMHVVCHQTVHGKTHATQVERMVQPLCRWW